MVHTRIVQFFRGIPKLLADNNLTKKASLNAFAAGLDYFANIIVVFVVTPFLVTGLGDYYYGVWQILMRLIGYLSPASGRPTQALKFTLAQEQQSLDFERKRSYVGSTLYVLAIFLPIMTVLGAILTWFVPYWIKAPDQYIWSIRIACGLLVLNLISISLAAIPRSVLEGENKGYKRMGLSTLLVFIGGGLTWLALYFNTGIVGVAGAALLATIIQGVFFLQVARTFCPWFGASKPAKNAVKGFLGLSWWFMAWNLIMSLMIASDVVVLGLLNSVESVTDYTLSKYAPETTITIIAMIVFGILPGLGGIIGSGDMPRAAKVRGEIMSFTWLIVTVLGTGMLLWNRTFLTIWIGPDHFVGSIANLLIVVVVFQFVFIRNDANVIDLTLHLNNKVILGAISVAISILAACILVYFFKMGIIGVSLGIILGRLLLSVAYPILIGHNLHIEFLSQLKAIIRPGLVAASLFVVATILDSYLPTDEWHSFRGWIAFLVSAGLSACFILGLSFFLGLSLNQRKNIYHRLKSIFNV